MRVWVARRSPAQSPPSRTRRSSPRPPIRTLGLVLTISTPLRMMRFRPAEMMPDCQHLVPKIGPWVGTAGRSQLTGAREWSYASDGRGWSVRPGANGLLVLWGPDGSWEPVAAHRAPRDRCLLPVRTQAGPAQADDRTRHPQCTSRALVASSPVPGRVRPLLTWR